MASGNGRSYLRATRDDAGDLHETIHVIMSEIPNWIRDRVIGDAHADRKARGTVELFVR